MTIGGKEGVDFIFQRLHGIIDVLLGLGDGIFFPLVLCHPFLGILEVLFIVELGIRGQNLIDAVSRAAPILARGHIGNDLRNLSSRRLDGLGTLHICIPNLETLLQHALEINQAAVGHGCIGAIIQVMIMDFPLLMGIGHVGWQEFQADGLADNPCCQITLGIENLAVLVGIFIDHRPILG